MDIVAGPPGSGKSVFFPVADRGYDSFNIDDHRKKLNQGSSQSISPEVRQQAIVEYEAFINGHIRDGKSFSFEATLAKDVTFDQAARAKQHGFQVHLTYVATDLEESVERVTRRALRGGHAAPPAVLHEAYAASMSNLPRAIRAFDIVQVYDNSVQAQLDDSLHEAKPRLVFEGQRGVPTYVARDVPRWLRSALNCSEYELD
jgi:predicted ABC-type ATPase